jgi:hypothetical protein
MHLQKATKTIFSIQQPSKSKSEKKPLTSNNEIIPDEKDHSIFTFTPKKKPNFKDPDPMSMSIQDVSTILKEENKSETEKHYSFNNALQKAKETNFVDIIESNITNVISDVGLILRARNPATLEEATLEEATLEEATQIPSEEKLVEKSKGNPSSRYSPPQIRPYQPNYPNSSTPRPSYSQPNRPQFQPRQQMNQHQSFPNHTHNKFRSQQPQPVLIKQEGVCTYCQIPEHDIYSCPEPNCRLSRLIFNSNTYLNYG